MPTIPEWYAGKHIFITGATGFMGKVLVEKLLRSCPNIGTIYILIRQKRGKNGNERLDDFLNSTVFDKLRDEKNSEKIFNKVKCVNGDVLYENLGISDEFMKILIENVTVFFHMAANVRFDQPLKDEIILNTKGTLYSLNVAEKLKNLLSFVYVSTSYCHCDQVVLEERFYPAPQDPLKMLDLVSWLDEDILTEMTPKFLKNSPNTYAYSKCLTEQLVSGYAKQFPVVITRPSIIINAWKEPIPGWVDNLNGPTGIVVAAGKGVVRTMYCKAELNTDAVPVDLTINGLIITAKELGTSPRSDEAWFVNLTNGNENAFTWGSALEICRKHFFDNPYSVCLWYPGGGPKSSYFVHMIFAFFLHVIPAYIVDLMFIIGRQKPFLVKLQKRIKVGLDVLSYYTTREWYFPNDKLKAMRERLSPEDKKIFYTDCKEINWNDYFLTFILGARKYCVHEEPSTIPRARKIMRRMYYLDQFKNVVLGCLFLWILYVCTTSLFDGINSFILLPPKLQSVAK